VPIGRCKSASESADLAPPVSCADEPTGERLSRRAKVFTGRWAAITDQAQRARTTGHPPATSPRWAGVAQAAYRCWNHSRVRLTAFRCGVGSNGPKARWNFEASEMNGRSNW
jgi:hypothetical protein